MYLAILILEYAIFATLSLVVPFVYVVVTGKFKKGVCLTWGLWILVTALIGIMSPTTAFLINSIYGTNPDFDGTGIFGGLIGLFWGWFPGLLISSLALLVRRIVLWLKREKSVEGAVLSGQNHK
jgi:hypothetical protein